MESSDSDKVILLSHGGGGQKTNELLQEVILPRFRNAILDRLDDSAALDQPIDRLAFTTDSYVIHPLFFPGGNIGHLAACGTINDLVMQGAQPLHLSLGLILEEGFSIPELDQILQSMADVLASTHVTLVTGDTKVVERGHAHGLFINTAGIGSRLPGVDVHVSNARPGDRILLSGSLGDHGIAVMAQRHDLQLPAQLTSDVAPLWDLLHPLLEELPHIHCLRDPTRGGLSAALCSIAQMSQVAIRIQEHTLLIHPAVQAACDILGLDPLHVANEGKAVVVCPAEDADHALALLRRHPLGAGAQIIGTVCSDPQGRVILETRVGGERLVEIPTGEDLPRIC